MFLVFSLLRQKTKKQVKRQRGRELSPEIANGLAVLKLDRWITVPEAADLTECKPKSLRVAVERKYGNLYELRWGHG